jgi:hypothetical protein
VAGRGDARSDGEGIALDVAAGSWLIGALPG